MPRPSLLLAALACLPAPLLSQDARPYDLIITGGHLLDGSGKPAVPGEVAIRDGREGAWADVVVFDLDVIRDRATFTDPHQYAEGIEWVLVNGEAVVEAGKPTGRLAGKVLVKWNGARLAPGPVRERRI